MTDCNNVILCYIGYRRNIKDMPFVNKLNDNELALGVSRSLSEIFGDELEFKSLKNVDINTCLKLEESGIITKELIENKDISAYAFSEDYSKKIYINENDHIRFEAIKNGLNLEECFKLSSCMDDLILEKLEMCFDNNLGYLTANPKYVGTGITVGCILFLPALWQSKKLLKLKNDILNFEFELYNLNGNVFKGESPFVKIENVYTFGHKENEFAELLQKIVLKLIELEKAEENNIFNISASTLCDNIYRAYGILQSCYRLLYEEAEKNLGLVLWGINLKMLKFKKKFNIYSFLAKIKEHHISCEDSIKEIEKKRAIIVSQKLNECVVKGEVDV